MKKLVTVIFIAIILFGLAIVELILINNYITELDNSVDALIIEYEENKDNVISLVPDIEKIKTKWDKTENALCLMFNHKDMTSITDCISKLLTYSKNNNYEDGIVELILLKEYSEKNPNIMGCNINNIM